jgi:cellulose synthase (UDP-forming)
MAQPARARLAWWAELINAAMDKVVPADPEIRHRLRVLGFRVFAIVNVALAVYYFYYRYTATINMNALWFAIPLLLAETYAFIDTMLFVVMMWKPAYRVPPPAPSGPTVDVFIATYNEPIEIVQQTAQAALAIQYPHKTFILDDGNRDELRQFCEKKGCSYITRGAEWKDRPRHAKAGNVNNALMQTSGEFILILDADQIPSPNILDRTLGYFTDQRLAFVQTPQYFYNVPPGDPFGSQAPLFYGPVMQGKDGWNAAFFCGSNAVLRREALFQLGLVTYVLETEREIRNALSRVSEGAEPSPENYAHPAYQVSMAARTAVRSLKSGQPIGQVLSSFQTTLNEVRKLMVAGDLIELANELSALEAVEASANSERLADISGVRSAIELGLTTLTEQLAEVAAPPVEVLGISPEAMQSLQLDRDEALDVNPLATFSITEDMATAMRLHALGWKSVFHPEILARGLAPEDLGSMLGQRLRWAAGTIQVFLRDNPMFKSGLSLGQRIQYFTTIYSYFSGLATIIFLIAPVIYLLFEISPVNSFSGEFLNRIAPYLIVNKLMFVYVAWGMEVFRGEQYNMALFPVWIQSIITVFSGRKLSFKVTPKTRQSGNYIGLVIPQLAITALLGISIVVGIVGMIVGFRSDIQAVSINIFWACYDILMLSVILKAAVYDTAQIVAEAVA